MKQAIAKALGVLGLMIGIPQFASATGIPSDVELSARPLYSAEKQTDFEESPESNPGLPSQSSRFVVLEQRLFAGQHVEQAQPKDRDQLNEMIIRSSLAAYGIPLPAAGIEESRRLLAAVPSHVPAVGFLTSGFGQRQSPFSGRHRFHRGIDIAAPYGTPIYAAAEGVVIFAGWSGPLGRLVVIHHGFGISTRYAHAASLLVNRGALIRRGDVIGTVGNSGRSTGAHLHFEVRVGRHAIDPTRFMFEAPADVDRVMIAANQVRPDDGLLGDTEVLDDELADVDLAADLAMLTGSTLTSKRQTPIDAQAHAREAAADTASNAQTWIHESNTGFGVGGESEQDEEDEDEDAAGLIYPSLDPSDQGVPLLPVNIGIICGFSLLALVLAAGDHLPSLGVTRRRQRF